LVLAVVAACMEGVVEGKCVCLCVCA
jgi:hypothetical protein